MLKNVLKRFSVISGLEGEEFSKWSFLCNESLNYVLEHMLKDELNECEEQKICSLAASIAFYKLTLYDFDGVTSFTAGDVHISKENIQKKAAIIMNEEMSRCNDITDFGSVCFFGVKA